MISRYLELEQKLADTDDEQEPKVKNSIVKVYLGLLEAIAMNDLQELG